MIKQQTPENVIVLTENSWYVILEPNLDECYQLRLFLSESDDSELKLELPEFIFWGSKTTYKIHRDEVYSGSVWDKLYTTSGLEL